MLISLLRGASVDSTQLIIYIVSSLCVIFLTLPIHEFAHAFVADKLGDRTARYQGRLSLNPMRHIDPFGAVCILLFGFGWAKPVPVTGYNFKRPKWDMALTALAGPFANIILAFVSLLLFHTFNTVGNAQYNAYLLIESGMVWIFGEMNIYLYIALFFYFVANINISLAVFNLIPIPPLDGSRLLTAILPNRIYYKIMQYERYFFIAIIALLWIGILDIPLAFLSNRLMKGVEFIAGLPFSF